MSITALLRRADQPAMQMRRISQAVVDLQLLQPPPSVPPTPVETLLDAALNARLSLIAGGRARKPVVDTPSLDRKLLDAVEAAITDR